MGSGNVNFEYLRLLKEPLLMARMHLWPRRKMLVGEGILIVNSCLVGEFAASLPALADCIKQLGSTPVDLVVSRPLKPLAQKIAGVRAVYVVRSIFDRRVENHREAPPLGPYAHIVVLRASPEVIELVATLPHQTFSSSLPHMLSYLTHVVVSVMRGRTPTSCRERFFEMLRSKVRYVPFEEIFAFDESDLANVRTLAELQTNEEKVVIHTGASWVMNRWPTRNWAQLLSSWEGACRFIFVGSGQDAADFADIQTRVPFRLYSLIEKVDIKDLMLVLRECDYFIGVDSGPRNLAHVADLPSVTLVGPAPHMFAPANPRDIVIDHSGGRKVYERIFCIFCKDKPLIETITPLEVRDAFARVKRAANRGEGNYGRPSRRS
jgi:ADP-heptose:LPS heptosyltransferase